MPLPDSDQVWPPANVETIYKAYEIDDAWFTGDTAQLGNVYANPANQGGSGWFGGMRRWFHGTPTPQNQTQAPVKLHLPIPAEITRMSASQLFGEMFTAAFEDDTPADEPETGAFGERKAKPNPYAELNAALAKALDDNAHARFLEGAEYASGHGGAFIKLAWDVKLHPSGPFFVVVPADGAIPEFRFGLLTAVTFWTRLAPIAKQHYLLLERHEPGTITYGLYESADQARLGHVVPLAAHPESISLAKVVDENASITTGTDLLTAQYLPNVKPNKKWRRDPLARNLGRSDFDGAYDVFDAADELFTSYMRDFRLGKARLTVPKGALTIGKPGQGATFNADQEIYVELGENVGSLNPDAQGGSAQAARMDMFQPNIREQEHREAIAQMKEWAFEACGYSPQSFGSAGNIATTATEVTSREKLTIQSRAAKILAARPPLELLLAALVDVAHHVFGGPARPTDMLPTIEFPDAASENPKVVAETLQALNVSESASIQTRVEMLHPDWTAPQVADEVQRIRDDYSMLPAPTEKNLWAAQAANGSYTGEAAPVQGGKAAPADPKGTLNAAGAAAPK